MKKQNKKTLALSKETLRKLNDSQLEAAAGGGYTQSPGCVPRTLLCWSNDCTI